MCEFPVYRKVKLKDSLRTFILQTSCGKCSECLKARRRDWTFRALAEARSVGYGNCTFMTLTYNQVSLLHHIQCDDFKHNLQCFFKRLRKRYGQGLKYILTTEFGEKYGRYHHHLIIFGLRVPTDYFELRKYERWFADIVWKNGHVDCNMLKPRNVAYVCKYIFCPSNPDSPLKPYFLYSRRPGLGASYKNKIVKRLQYEQNKYGKFNHLWNFDGFTYRIPRYYTSFVLQPDHVKYDQLKAAERYGADSIRRFREEIRRKHGKIISVNVPGGIIYYSSLNNIESRVEQANLRLKEYKSKVKLKLDYKQSDLELHKDYNNLIYKKLHYVDI